MNFNENYIDKDKKKEVFPTKEELESTIRGLAGNGELVILKEVSGADGVSRYDVEVTREDGSKVEYNYQKAQYDYRDTSLAPTMRFAASIHSIIYDEDGMPCGGECVANYLDGVWTYLE